MKRLTKLMIMPRNQGQILVLVAVSLVLLLALAALATDVGIAYGIKAKLNAAVDGAAYAGAVAARKADPLNRQTDASNAAEIFFDANYPPSYMSSSVLSGWDPKTTVTVVNNVVTVSVEARATPPRFFARALNLLNRGWGEMTVKASAVTETKISDLDMILVLDCSGSLGPPYSPSTTFPRLKAAAKYFLEQFDANPGGDRVGLISFASGVATTLGDGFIPIDKTTQRGFNISQMKTTIDSLTVGGSTASAEALRRALVELDAINPSIRSSLRVIVFFSDGAPNDVAGSFNDGGTIRRGDLYSEGSGGSSRARYMWSSTSRNSPPSGNIYGNIFNFSSTMNYDYTNYPYNAYPSYPVSFLNNTRNVSMIGQRILSFSGSNVVNTRCNVNKAAKNMAENIANVARTPVSGYEPVTIYTLGLGNRLLDQEFQDSSCYSQTNASEFGENILKRIANVPGVDTFKPAPQPSGKYCFAQDDDDLEPCFRELALQIIRFKQ